MVRNSKGSQAGLLFVLVRALVVDPHSDLRVALCPVARLRLELQLESLALLGRDDLAQTQQQRVSCRWAPVPLQPRRLT